MTRLIKTNSTLMFLEFVTSKFFSKLFSTSKIQKARLLPIYDSFNEKTPIAEAVIDNISQFHKVDVVDKKYLDGYENNASYILKMKPLRTMINLTETKDESSLLLVNHVLDKFEYCFNENEKFYLARDVTSHKTIHDFVKNASFYNCLVGVYYKNAQNPNLDKIVFGFYYPEKQTKYDRISIMSCFSRYDEAIKKGSLSTSSHYLYPSDLVVENKCTVFAIDDESEYLRLNEVYKEIEELGFE